VSVLITNNDHDGLTAGLLAVKADLDTAQETHRAMPARLPPGEVNPGQQVLDTQADHSRHPDHRVQRRRHHPRPGRRHRPHDGFLTARLEPLPTRRATTANAELCEPPNPLPRH